MKDPASCVERAACRHLSPGRTRAARTVSAWLLPNCVQLEADSALMTLLSAAERGRAASYVSSDARATFVVTRAVLRLILGHHLGREPAAIRLATSKYGKPYVAEAGGGSSVWFNVSHSRDYGLVATSDDGPVGADVEWIDASVDAEAIAARYFDPPELGRLQASPKCARGRLFYTLWVRKEAYWKAVGTGLPGLERARQARVALHDADVRREEARRKRWHAIELRGLHGYAAAVVAPRGVHGCVVRELGPATVGAPLAPPARIVTAERSAGYNRKWR
jgi:4'-phosphopantetheinyl transferase